MAAVAVALLAGSADAFKPIVALHGFTGSYKDYNTFIEELNRVEPGHVVFSLDVDNDWASTQGIHTLVKDAIEALEKVIRANETLFRDGFIFIGHSQGGIVSRAMIEARRWNITKYISLAGVQSGFYGDCGIWFGKNATCDLATNIMYSSIMQNSFSVAGYWKSPHRDWYLKGNTFLPSLDNEEGVATTAEYQKMQKENFLAVREFHFFGSPDDEVIRPWFSSLFQTLATDEETAVPLQKQYIFINDTFGLRTAVEQGRAHFHKVPGVSHAGWIGKDLEVLHRYIFPLLD